MFTHVFLPSFLPSCSESEAADGSIVATNAQQSEDNAQIFVMNNYFGIGLDADVSLEFHNKREAKPEKFNSRLHNKGVYFKVGGCKDSIIRKKMLFISMTSLNMLSTLAVHCIP